MRSNLIVRTPRLTAASLTVGIFLMGLITVVQAQPENRLVLMETVSVVDYGRQTVGTSTAGQLLTFTNSGAGSLAITRVRLTGLNPTDFVIMNDTCTNAALNSATTCGVTVGFAPQLFGNRTARLAVETNAGSSPHEMPIAGYGLDLMRGPARAVGPVDMRFGFPFWYQDDAGVKLQLCLDTNGLCLASAPNTAAAASITDGAVNFPDEAFWWNAEARPTRPSGGRVLLVLAKEAAFIRGIAAIAEQITFDRLRIRIDRLVAGKTYKITHPFGIVNLKADARGEIDFTEDIGCTGSPCDFQKSLTSSLSRFLTWDPSVAPAASAGYVGDPNVPHKAVGSPFGTNLFKVEGTNAGGTNIHVIQTDLFRIQGKLAGN